MHPLLTNPSIEIITVSHMLLGPAWKASNQQDDMSRMYFIRSGEAFLQHHQREFCLRPGYLYLVPAGTPISFQCPKEFLQHFVHFRISICGGVDLFRLLECSYELPCADAARSLELLDELECTYYQEHPATSLISSGILLQLIEPFLASAKVTTVSQQGLLRLRPVLEFIEANLDQPLTLKGLARLIHLEATYFSRFFKAHMNQGPMAYLLHRRVERSKRLLLSSDRSLKDIGKSLGFYDEFHFSRTFKRLAGKTPREFRETARLP